jgi:hypothetical protein
MLRRKQTARSRKHHVRVVRHRTPVREAIAREEHIVAPEGARGYDEFDHSSVGYGIETMEDVPIDPMARH